MVTSKLFIIVLVSILQSCALALDPNVTYRKELILCSLGDVCLSGVGVLSAKKKYKFHVKAKGRITHLFMQTSHREIIIKDPFVKEGMKKNKLQAKFNFTPNEIEEGSLYYFSALDGKKGKHSWGRFVVNRGQKDCSMLCEGKLLKGKDLMCQTKQGTKVRVYKSKEDKVSKGDYKVTDSYIDIVVPKGESNLVLADLSKKYCVIYLDGYEKVAVLEY